MEALELESQTDQSPLASRRRYSPKAERPTAEYPFHDARLWVSEVVLVTGACSWQRWGWWAATWATSRRALPFLALRQLGLILRLLGCCTLFGARFQDRFGLCQACQAVLAPSDFLAHHQPVGNLRLLALFAQHEQFLDLASQPGLQLQQTLVADRLALG